MGYPLWKNVHFLTFLTSCFYILERRFFGLEYRKRYFPGLYCQKKKVGKMAIFRPKPWVNPFGKMSIFRLFNVLLLAFFVLDYRKKYFPGSICLKKKHRKSGHFWTKTLGLPLWKNVYFWTVWTCCFYSLESCFFVLEYRKRHFYGLNCLKKIGKNGHSWIKTIG